MAQDKPKNYPNVRVSPETFEILGYLKEERGSSYDAVIKDMLSEFAPFLVEMVSTKNDTDVTYVGGDKETIDRYNILLGAKQAYADYWLRVKHRQEEEIESDRVSSEVRSIYQKDFKKKSEMKK